MLLLSLIHYFGVLFSVLRGFILWSDKPLCVIWKEKYRSSGEPFSFEATKKYWPGNRDYMVNFQPG